MDREVTAVIDRAAIVTELQHLAENYRAAGYFRAWVALTDVADMLADPSYNIPSICNQESRPK